MKALGWKINLSPTEGYWNDPSVKNNNYYEKKKKEKREKKKRKAKETNESSPPLRSTRNILGHAL